MPDVPSTGGERRSTGPQAWRKTLTFLRRNSTKGVGWSQLTQPSIHGCKSLNVLGFLQHRLAKVSPRWSWILVGKHTTSTYHTRTWPSYNSNRKLGNTIRIKHKNVCDLLASFFPWFGYHPMNQGITPVVSPQHFGSIGKCQPKTSFYTATAAIPKRTSYGYENSNCNRCDSLMVQACKSEST